MLCRRCRRQLARRSAACSCCGDTAGTGRREYELVLPDRARVALAGELSIGRGAQNALRIDDPSVSRAHARILPGPDGPLVEDRGSRHGTFVDGRRVRRAPLGAGARVRVGDTELVLEPRTAEPADGRTLVVRPGASILVGAVADGPHQVARPVPAARPRLRSGWALKRLADDGHVLKDLRSGRFVQLDDDDAALLVLLDGRRTVARLALEAQAVCGADGPARLVGLLADLADRGMVSGVAGHEAGDGAQSRLARLVRPRRWAWAGAGAALERLYSAGGWLLFTRAALGLVAAIVLAGLATFAVLVTSGARTPLVIGGEVTVGSAVFLCGRLALAGVHELAHGLTITSFGRRVSCAGVKRVLVFPYLFVDTSDAWFERRGRRIAIAAAGPASDLALGGACAGVALLAGGLAADIAFQLACGAYVGALYNLNPLLERDGYHVLADALRQPALRARARRRLAALLAGRAPRDPHGRVLTIYAVAALAWSLVAAGLVVATSQSYRTALEEHLPGTAVWALLGALYLAALAPFALALGGALLARRRRA